MPSIIEGYNYDIFISYRQKDNKGNRWVSEFVEALKTELESTFKEEVSVYFDINPHDGLLETHDVDASLKDKLKCLIFIPIISRTYCDLKSFAWQHEFKAFVELASQDQFGLKVKLPNGNVSSRVLPVRIYDLDSSDIKLCESVLSGVLRGVEFIYTEPGVNRPLKSDDDEKINLNKTKYRNQINKVANAIDEIISGLKAAPALVSKEIIPHIALLEEVKKEELHEKTIKTAWRKLLSGIAILAILVVAAVLIYPKIFKRDTLENLRAKGKISVAVMPFQNMTNDTIWNVWQDGIQNELITSLTNSEELKVRQTESINTLIQSKGLTNYALITPSVASNISQKLEADIFVYGSIKEGGGTIRVNAQLIDSKTQDALKSFQLDGTSEKILTLTDSLSRIVKNFLIVSVLQKEIPADMGSLSTSNSPEAFKYFIYGENAFSKYNYIAAQEWLSKAIAIDSNFIFPFIMLSGAYLNTGLYDQGRTVCIKIYNKRNQMSDKEKIWANALHAYYFETPNEQIRYLGQMLDLDDQQPTICYQLGLTYLEIYQYEKAILELNKALDIYHKWGSKPFWSANYRLLGKAYHKTGQYKKENNLYRRAEKDFPDDPGLIYRQAVLALTQKNINAANRYVGKLKSILKENSNSEADIATDLADIYSEADIPDIADTYYRKALSFEPASPDRLNNLAWFLIDKDRNIKEGLELIEKAINEKTIRLSPDEYYILDTEGWGLYKQGKYNEALKILEKSDSLKPIYDHDLFLHLEAAKKAGTVQK